MTIPEIGHCAGSGAKPLDGTVEGLTGMCASCSGRFEIRSDGSLSLHEPADIANREEVDATKRE